MISAFSIVKNEAQFIGYGVMSLLPHVPEIVYADGDSTDGTLELLDYIKRKYAGERLRVLRGMDCKDLKADYQRVFNELMKQCKGDYLWYCHPDMILVDPGEIGTIGRDQSKWAYSVNLRNFAGDDIGWEIAKGRAKKWKTIMKNDFGLHYWGNYGDGHEDMYFSEITGDEHVVYQDMKEYPFHVWDSGVELWHLCECKPKKRREEKMQRVFETAGVKDLGDVLARHPRVTLESGKTQWGDFEFVPREDPLPEVFEKYREEFNEVLKG